jgi:hypothetical protein
MSQGKRSKCNEYMMGFAIAVIGMIIYLVAAAVIHVFF